MIRPVLKLCVALLFLTTASAVPLREELKVESGTLHYRIFGKGKPVVIVGGIAGASSDYLLSVAQELGKTHQVILVDLRGTGKSKVAAVDTSIISVRLILNDLDGLRSTLKLSKWTVLGHSVGGILAMAYAVRFPAQTQALVLVSSGGIDLDYLNFFSPNVYARLTHEDSLRIEQAMRGRDRQAALTEEFQIKLAGYVADRKYLAAATSWFPREAYSPEVAQVMWRSLFKTNYNFKEPLKKFKRPVLQIQGEQDPADKRTADQIHETLRHSKLVYLKNCGHFPWLEQGEQFYRAVKQFLKGVK